MPIFKSHKVVFIAKLVLLLPLSFITFVTAMVGMKEGDNRFPSIVVFGPVNIVSAIFKTSNPDWAKYSICGTLFLYLVYALFLKFIKSGKTFFAILSFHILLSLLTMCFYSMSTLFGVDGLLLVVLLVPWMLVIWLLKSIHKSRGLW